MARNYHIDIAAFAADADRKWIDNVLSHFDVPGVESQKRGVARRLSLDAIRIVVLIRTLAVDTGLTIDRALTTALHLLGASDAESAPARSSWVSLHLDRRAFEAHVDRRVAAAVEAVVPRRRGRPPSRNQRK